MPFQSTPLRMKKRLSCIRRNNDWKGRGNRRQVLKRSETANNAEGPQNALCALPSENEILANKWRHGSILQSNKASLRLLFHGFGPQDHCFHVRIGRFRASLSVGL